ncbi:TPA: ArdC-like ssDNA-binding domain-containing protein, partial [Salmonella enterica subsp. enterica serovar Muenchen]
MVTDRIIAALEQGTAPWRRPWRCVGTGDPGGLPSNALTGRCYSGVNVLLLWLAAEEGGYTSDRWLTYRQAQEAGGQVRKRESCSLAVIYKDWTKPAEDEHGNRLYDTDGRLLTETVPM